MAQFNERPRRVLQIMELADGRFVLLGWDWPHQISIDTQVEWETSWGSAGQMLLGPASATAYDSTVHGRLGGCKMVWADNLEAAMRVMGDEMNRDPGAKPEAQRGLNAPR